MLQCIVIADDLTGANATGVQLTKIDLKTYTLMNEERLNLESLSHCDCVIYPTDSRGIDSVAAYNRVFNATKLLQNPDAKVYSKRIDSTLRGNLGSETDAILDALDDGRVAIVVPCFPQAGRITVGGYLLVNSIPLHSTEAAADPKNPIDTSLVSELFGRQSKYPIDSVYMDDLAKGAEHVAKRIGELKESGTRIILFDAATQEDMELISGAVIASRVPFVAVDPGVFTSVISRKLVAPSQEKNQQKILVVVGSVNAVAAGQVEKLLLSQKVHNVYINIAEILESEERRKAEVARVVKDVVDGCKDFEVCSVVGAGIKVENRVDFSLYTQRHNCTGDDLSRMINNAIAEITHEILTANVGFGGLYTCGGDIAVAVCKRLDTFGMHLMDEVVPLAAYGELMGGSFGGLKLVTKGGMVGNEDAIVTCVRYLKEKLFA